MQPVGKEKQLALPARHQAAEPRARSLVIVVFSYRRYYLYGYTGAAVPLNIRNETVNQLAKKLAVRKHLNKTEAVKVALENELRRIEEALPLRDRLRPLQQRVLARPATGLEADKAFHDELSGDT